ncbi:hypothetical protein EU523_00090, partial [Candidatus Heimdallarchaeota archaeon]
MSKVLRRFAYMRVGQYLEPILPYFEDLGKTLRKAGMEVSLRMYLAIAFLSTGISLIVSFPAALGIFYFIYMELTWIEP